MKRLFMVIFLVIICSVSVFAQQETEDIIFNDVKAAYSSSDYLTCVRKADKYLDTYVTGSSRYQLVMLYKALALEKLDKMDESIAVFTLHDELYPNNSKNPMVKIYLARLLYKTGQYYDALAVANEFFSKYSGSEQAPEMRQIHDDITEMINSANRATMDEIAGAYAEQNYTIAIELAELYIVQNPHENISRAAFIAGASYYKLELYGRAIRQQSIVIQDYPEFELREQALYIRGSSYFQVANYDEAKIDLKAVVIGYPDGDYYKKADKLLKRIESISASTGSEANTGYDTTRSRFRWTAGKIAGGVGLASTGVFYAMGLTTQIKANSVYEDYIAATNSRDAVNLYVDSRLLDQRAAFYKSIALTSLVFAAVTFTFDIIFESRRPGIGYGLRPDHYVFINPDDNYYAFELRWRF